MKWTIDESGAADIKAQAQMLLEDIGTPREWVAVGISDSEGFAEVTALCHPANAPIVAKAPELVSAMRELFEHCTMVHTHWGENCNQREADAAIKKARALLNEIDQRSTITV